jgi:PhnB protein
MATAKAVKPMPAGFHTVTPYLTVHNAANLMEFLKKAFGATERYKLAGPKGGVMHAEMQVGDSIVMIGEAQKETDVRRTMLYVYMPDCDASYKKAVAAGAKSLREPSTMFYGDRSGSVQDPTGNEWWIATHVEDVAPDEMERRMKAQSQTQHA